MMKKNNWLLFIAVASFLGTVMIYSRLPDQMPIHWNTLGEVDNYGGKGFSLLMAVLPIAIYALMILLPKIDPRRENYAKHGKAYMMMQSGIVLLFVILNWVTIGFALGYDLNVGRFVTIGIGVLFIVIGNYLSQIRHNYFVGIKNPWTLANEQVWKKTHRLGGIGFVVVGILLAASTYLGTKMMTPVIIGSVLVLVLGLNLYSYLVFRDLSRKGSE
jgi:uncharacterized membrane protein